jgi:hypothetical protein
MSAAATCRAGARGAATLAVAGLLLAGCGSSSSSSSASATSASSSSATVAQKQQARQRAQLSPHRPRATHSIQGSPDTTLRALAKCAVERGFTVASPGTAVVRIIATGKGISVARDARTAAGARALAAHAAGRTVQHGSVLVTFGTHPNARFVDEVRGCLDGGTGQGA